MGCGLHFTEGDLLEIDHINPVSCGGKKEWKNLQLLHRHCHDVKTATDGSQKSRNDKRETHWVAVWRDNFQARFRMGGVEQ